VLEARDKVFLEIAFKKVPLNREPFVDVIGPLPSPTNSWADLSVCFFVRDINQSKKRNKDRELDLNQTRDHYRQLLTDSGLPASLLRNLCVMPVREVITEYTNFQARNKLAATYDVFLVDATLYNNKFKFLRSFLGSAFTDRSKKCPIPVMLRDPEKIKKNVLTAVRSTNMYISGFGQTCTVLIGRRSFDQLTLAKNLKQVISRVQRKYDSLVGTLKLCDESMQGITFFADLRTVNNESFAEKFPLRKAKRVRTTIAAQYKGQVLDDEISDVELETEGGKYELKQKKVRYEDISIF
jgi:hypothetical protein